MSSARPSSRPDRARSAAGDIIAGKFALEAVISESKTGTLWAARHVGLDKPVALKLLPATKSQEARTRFLREARAAAQLESPHAPQVLDVDGQSDGTLYMLMEPLGGRDLGARLAERGPLAVSEAVDVAIQACDVLAEAHGKGIVHRHLTPASWLIDDAGGEPRLKLLDFGLCKLLGPVAERDGKATVLGLEAGVPDFMSPEQIRVEPVDHRTDIWSLGAVLHRALAGTGPFPGPTVAAVWAAIAADDPQLLSETRGDMPAELEAVVLRCLAKDPAQRFASIAELARALAPFATPGGRDLAARVGQLPPRQPVSLRPLTAPGPTLEAPQASAKEAAAREATPAEPAAPSTPPPGEASIALPLVRPRTPQYRLLGVAAVAIAFVAALAVLARPEKGASILQHAPLPSAVQPLAPRTPSAAPTVGPAQSATKGRAAAPAASHLAAPTPRARLRPEGGRRDPLDDWSAR